MIRAAGASGEAGGGRRLHISGIFIVVVSDVTPARALLGADCCWGGQWTVDRQTVYSTAVICQYTKYNCCRTTNRKSIIVATKPGGSHCHDTVSTNLYTATQRTQDSGQTSHCVQLGTIQHYNYLQQIVQLSM